MKIRVFVSTLIATLIASVVVHAQSYTWTNGSSDGFWNTTSANWDDGLFEYTWPSAGSYDAVFGTGTPGTVNVAAGVTVNNLTFNTAGYTLSGSSLAITGELAVNANTTIATNLLTGSAGALMGNTTITGATLTMAPGAALYYTTDWTKESGSVVTVGSGGTLVMSSWNWGSDGLSYLNPGSSHLVINGGTVEVSSTNITWGSRGFTIGANGATLKNSLTGGAWGVIDNGGGWGLQAVDNSSLTLAGDGTGSMRMNMDIIGTGSLTKSGSSEWMLSGSNSYTGATNINGGRLNVGANNTGMLGSGSSAVTIANVAGAELYNFWWDSTANGGAGTNVGTSFSIGSLSGGGTTGGTVTLGQMATLTVGTDNTSTTYGGTMTELWGSAGLTKVGTGTLTLTNHIYLSGTATISGGALQLGDGTTGHNGSLNSMNVVNNGSLIFDNFESQVSANLISGTGSLTKNGAGILELNAVNTYSGATIINSGTLQLIQTNATLGSGSSAVTLANTADTLLSLNAGNWGAVNISIGSLSGGGALGGNIDLHGDTLTVGSDNTSTTYAGSIINNLWGNGNLTKVGTGTLTLTGTNYYFGTTTVSGGVLELASTAKLYSFGSWSTGVSVNSGGTLRLYNWGDWVDSLNQNSADATKLTLDNGTIDMAAAGAVTGSRNFTVGAGGATLLVSNAAGNWTLNNGSGNVTNNSSLTLDGIGTGQIYMAVNGTGALIKNGAGSWSLGAANGYTGNTTVNAGTLKLAAGGSISGSTLVEIKAGAIFDTTAQSFTMLGTQTFRFTINGTTGQVGKLVAGTLDITAGVVDFSTSGFLSAPAYVIASYSPGGLTGTFASVTAPSGGWIIDYNYQGLNEIALVVPEPQTWVMMLSGVGMLALFRRRRS